MDKRHVTKKEGELRLVEEYVQYHGSLQRIEPSKGREARILIWSRDIYTF